MTGAKYSDLRMPKPFSKDTVCRQVYTQRQERLARLVNKKLLSKESAMEVHRVIVNGRVDTGTLYFGDSSAYRDVLKELEGCGADGVLLYGPSKTGKLTFAINVAMGLNAHPYIINCSDLKDDGFRCATRYVLSTEKIAFVILKDAHRLDDALYATFKSVVGHAWYIGLAGNLPETGQWNKDWFGAVFRMPGLSDNGQRDLLATVDSMKVFETSKYKDLLYILIQDLAIGDVIEVYKKTEYAIRLSLSTVQLSSGGASVKDWTFQPFNKPAHPARVKRSQLSSAHVSCTNIFSLAMVMAYVNVRVVDSSAMDDVYRKT